MSSSVLVERVSGVSILTINRPEPRNAINHAVALGISEALDDLDEGKNAFRGRRPADFTGS